MKKDIDYGFSDGSMRYRTTTFDDVGWPTDDEEQSINIIDSPEVGNERLETVRAELLGEVAAKGGGVLLNLRYLITKIPRVTVQLFITWASVVTFITLLGRVKLRS